MFFGLSRELKGKLHFAYNLHSPFAFESIILLSSGREAPFSVNLTSIVGVENGDICLKKKVKKKSEPHFRCRVST